MYQGEIGLNLNWFKSYDTMLFDGGHYYDSLEYLYWSSILMYSGPVYL